MYRQPGGSMLQDATKKEPIDRTVISQHNGFRLPTSTEYEASGRYLGTKKSVFDSAADELITTQEGNTTHYWAPPNGLQTAYTITIAVIRKTVILLQLLLLQ